MQPTSIEILNSCVANLEEIVLPLVQGDPHGKSAGTCISMLLKHVALRLEKEGAVLTRENRDKRELLAELAATLAQSAPHISERIGADLRTIVAQPAYVAIDNLTAENYALKELVEVALGQLHELGNAAAEAAIQRIRREIRADIDHEMSMITPAIPLTASGPAFF